MIDLYSKLFELSRDWLEDKLDYDSETQLDEWAGQLAAEMKGLAEDTLTERKKNARPELRTDSDETTRLWMAKQKPRGGE